MSARWENKLPFDSLLSLSAAFLPAWHDDIIVVGTPLFNTKEMCVKTGRLACNKIIDGKINAVKKINRSTVVLHYR